MGNINDPSVKYFQEKFGIKKLKPIPLSTIAYVQVEGENIKTANDKYMIASYCLGKIELVEWYIELIDAGSKKYIVPHDKKYLERMRNQLIASYNYVMRRPIKDPNEPQTFRVVYPGDLNK